MQLNGVILLSSILNYGRRRPGLRPGDGQLPAELCGGAGLSPPARQSSRPTCRAFLDEVREFARGPYAAGAGQGPGPRRRRPPARSPTKMAAYIGLPVDYILAQRPARPAGALPQGAAARPAPDARPLRRPLHRRGRRRGRREPGVRSLRHRHHRRLRRRLPRLSDARPRLRDRPRLPADLLFVRRAAGTSTTRPPGSAAAATTTRPTWRSTSRRPCARTRTCCSIR